MFTNVTYKYVHVVCDLMIRLRTVFILSQYMLYVIRLGYWGCRKHYIPTMANSTVLCLISGYVGLLFLFSFKHRRQMLIKVTSGSHGHVLLQVSVFQRLTLSYAWMLKTNLWPILVISLSIRLQNITCNRW